MADASVQSIRYTSPDTSMDWQTLANSFLTGMQARQKENKSNADKEKEFQDKLFLSSFPNMVATGQVREAKPGEIGMVVNGRSIPWVWREKAMDYGEANQKLDWEKQYAEMNDPNVAADKWAQGITSSVVKDQALMGRMKGDSNPEDVYTAAKELYLKMKGIKSSSEPTEPVTKANWLARWRKLSPETRKKQKNNPSVYQEARGLGISESEL